MRDPSWEAGPGRRSHGIADGWCAQAHGVTIRRGGERVPVARATSRAETQRLQA